MNDIQEVGVGGLIIRLLVMLAVIALLAWLTLACAGCQCVIVIGGANEVSPTKESANDIRPDTALEGVPLP